MRPIIKLSILLLFVFASGVYADGFFVWRQGADLKEPTQRAVIYYKDGTEVLLLQVKYEGQAKDFGWVVPLPSKPKVIAVEPNDNPFAELSLYTQRRASWGSRTEVDPVDPELESSISVLERKIAGVYDIAVISASNTGALTKWLNANGFSFPDNRKDVLEYYTAKKWVYAAMRIDPNALDSDEVKKLKTGELQPIRFEFKTNEAVYPLKISSINSGVTEVLLYVLSDIPLLAKNAANKTGLSIDENICHIFTYQDPAFGTFRKALAQELPRTWMSLGLQKIPELSLCKYRAYYKTSDMKEDLIFEKFDPLPHWKKKIAVAGYSEAAQFVLAYYNPENLIKYAEDKDEYKRTLAAANPKTPRKVLLKLAKDSNSLVRRTLADNPKTPTEVMMILAEDSDVWIRLKLAGNINVPETILRKLAKDPYHLVRYAVANQMMIPQDLLIQMANDKDEWVRSSIAARYRIPLDVLVKLAADSNEIVRARAAYNPNIPKKMLRILAKDTHYEVRRHVAANIRTEADVLAELSCDIDVPVRLIVAQNSMTTGDILNKMANDAEEDVREQIAANPNTYSHVLDKLASDNSPDVIFKVAENPHTPVETLKKLAEDRERGVRFFVARNINAPEAVLIKLSQDKEEYIRFTVIDNPHCPEELLKKIAQDSDNAISAYAKKALERYGY